MHVIAPGTEVTVDPDRLKKAHVLKSLIEGDSLFVSYECVYWTDGERKTAWFSSFEVACMEEETGDGTQINVEFDRTRGTK
jgi:hypothetical protein